MTTNPALATLQFLAGAWDMELSEASFLPDPDASVHGPVTSSGSNRARPALRMRMDGAATPTATWIIGRDDSRPDYCVLYTDDRGISRAYEMSFSDRTWRMWRDTPEFSQRFDGEVSTGQAEIIGSWQKPVDGGRTWEHDFKVRYSRLGPPGRPWRANHPGGPGPGRQRAVPGTGSRPGLPGYRAGEGGACRAVNMAHTTFPASPGVV
jgi:hypothetical protein